MGRSVTRRRETDPQTVQRLWEAIAYIRGQKQVANAERITRYMKREFAMGDEGVRLLLDHSSKEGLTVRYNSSSSKLSNSYEQEGYLPPTLNEESFEKGSHDWYCFSCHRPGEVVDCSECWRSYHVNCLEKSAESSATASTFICPCCLPVETKTTMSRKLLNQLLTFTVARLKEKSDDLHRLGGDQEIDELRRQYFIYEYIDLNEMERRTQERHYESLQQFDTDTRTVLHCALISFGQTGFVADLARQMMMDCDYDLSEIRRCKDCYLYSNEKPNGWFSIPCDPPHRLVYAKQRGFSYWPGKVLQIFEDGTYDVRFFAGQHERAVVSASYVKPIDTNYKTLGLKSSKALTDALAEVSRHERLLSSSEPHHSWANDDDEDDKPLQHKKGRETKGQDTKRKSRGRPVKALKSDEEESKNEIKKKKSRSTSTNGAGGKRPKMAASDDELENDVGEKTWSSAGRMVKRVKENGVRGKSKSSVGGVSASRGASRVERGREESEAEVSEEEPIVKKRPHKNSVTPAAHSKNKRKHSTSKTSVSAATADSDEDMYGDLSTSPAPALNEPTCAVSSSADGLDSKPPTSSSKKTKLVPVKNKAVQTTARALDDVVRGVAVETQTLGSVLGSSSETLERGAVHECKCREEYESERKELEAKLEEEHRRNVKAALEELKNTLYTQFEEARNQSLRAAEERSEREMEEKQVEIENKCRVEYVNVIKSLESEHAAMIAAVKKKQWCYNCGEEAMYHCCWNTSYCSTNCQQEHWQTEHKRVCRRKRKT